MCSSAIFFDIGGHDDVLNIEASHESVAMHEDSDRLFQFLKLDLLHMTVKRSNLLDTCLILS
jgi:hypothetical protein